MPNYEIAHPSAEALIESLRAVGYSLPTAIADIIDNSITAEAQNIWLNFNWAGPKSWISIVDDGKGMSDEVLFNAMRPGSKSPMAIRSPSDLGRFGLGLKTASFSQCRLLSVVSKTTSGETSSRCWDLDFVAKHDEWRLLLDATKVTKDSSKVLNILNSGTLVMLESLDRVVGDASVNDQRSHEHFLGKINEVIKHLAMTFHRFIATPKPRLNIWINGTDQQHLVKAWDPFMEGHICTTRTPFDLVSFGGEIVNIRGYVLPHKDKLNESEFDYASGPRGWNSQQGFYIYRNDRMLVSGSWLNLGPIRAWPKEEHYKLARLSIDIPNSMDSEWSLDVKKSAAMPPQSIRYRLMKLAEDVRGQARRVFVHRGEYGPRGSRNPSELERPWVSATRNGKTIYKISRQHPLIEGVLCKLGSLKPEAEAMLRFLEETVPVQKIWLDAAETNHANAIPYEGIDENTLVTDMKRIWQMLLDSGVPEDEARMRIGSMEPFNRYPEEIIHLKK
jgi:hypothetical protein